MPELNGKDNGKRRAPTKAARTPGRGGPELEPPPRPRPSVLTPPTPRQRGLRSWLDALVEDVDAVIHHDPAARTRLEVVLTYPGLHAVWMHRVANRLQRSERPLAARMTAHLNRFLTGVEIHPAAQLGRGIFIDHGMGVVIGETAIVGDHCVIYKGAVLGGTSLERTLRHPTLGRAVVVGTNACILGAITIGDEARVGSGSVVIRDVPARATVVGVPGRVVPQPGLSEPTEQLDHANLPDPIVDLLKELASQVEELKARLAQVEAEQEARALESAKSAEPAA